MAKDPLSRKRNRDLTRSAMPGLGGVRRIERHGRGLRPRRGHERPHADRVEEGAANFHNAYLKEWRTHFKDSPKHIADIRLTGQIHNNKMERMNGEIRDREKVMRGLKVEETPILTRMQIYHNFIRPHMALEGATPAEKAGIQVKGEDKWKTLIQNAAISRTAPDSVNLSAKSSDSR